MSGARKITIKRRKATARLPDWAGEGVALVLHLMASGFLNEIEQRLQIVRRGGGYVGIDAVLHLLFYFASGEKRGLGKFDGKLGGVREQLAALGGRDSLATQSAMSRLLAAVTPESVRAITWWLLHDVAEIFDILSHRCMTTLDRLGRPWHLFDYDPTKTALRQRDLPEGDDLPPPRRRTAGFAAPGYAGRKRGECVISRSVVQHSGSRLWVESRIETGNGDKRAQFDAATEAVGGVCDRLDHPRSRALLRFDGEFGGVPAITAVREAGLCGIGRLNRPTLLNQPDVRRHLAAKTWYYVPDSRSGPRRSAMDLGTVTVWPGQKTVRDDGTAYEPVDVRVVVSRYPRDKKAEHGQVIGGWQYELFTAIDLDFEGWAASDVVAGFYGRGGEENGFSQEDRETGLDHVFSYNLAGQELVCLIGLLVWNLRVVLGFRMNPLPDGREPAQHGVLEVDSRPVPEGFVEEVEKAEARDPNESIEPTEQVDEPQFEDPRVVLAEQLSTLDMHPLLRRNPSWEFDRERGEFRCEAGQVLPLTSVAKTHSRTSSQLNFEASIRSCRACPMRDSCLPTTDISRPKKVRMQVTKTVGDLIAGQLTKVRIVRRAQPRAEAEPLPSGRKRRPPYGSPFDVRIAEGDQVSGPWEIDHPQFLSAAARHAFRATCSDIVVCVTVTKPIIEPPHPYLVTTAAQRQHRRWTWAERNAKRALHEDARLSVVIEGGERLTGILGLEAGATPAAA